MNYETFKGAVTQIYEQLNISDIYHIEIIDEGGNCRVTIKNTMDKYTITAFGETIEDTFQLALDRLKSLKCYTKPDISYFVLGEKNIIRGTLKPLYIGRLMYKQLQSDSLEPVTFHKQRKDSVQIEVMAIIPESEI